MVLAVRHYNSKNPAKMTFFFVDLPSLCSDPHEWEMPGPNSGRRIRGCGRPVQGVSSYEGNESHLKNQKKMVVKINFAAILWYIARVAS